MKRIALVATVLSSALLPMAAFATPTVKSQKQAVCIPVIVDAGEGPVEGELCFPYNGRT